MQTNVLEYLERGALACCPNGIAISSGHTRYTFRELYDTARRCASEICRTTAVRNRPVVALLPKGPQTVAADLAALYSGNCYTNLDVNSPQARAETLLRNLQPALVVTDAKRLALARALGFDNQRTVVLDSITADIAVADAELMRRRERALDTDPVCIVNTSGSTGIPKSVVMNHRNIIDFMDWTFEHFPFNRDDVIASLSPFYFDIYTLELWLSMATGARLSIIPDSYAAFPVKLLNHLAGERATFLFWVPTIMVNIANLGLLEKVDLASLKRVFFAGEVFPTKQFNRWRRNLPGAQFVNLYGPIEITVDCTYFLVDRDFADSEALPIGRPCRNTDILILDENNRPVRAGETGELCVRGSSLAMGYWNDPERTAAAFVQNPLNTAYPERIYRTGDLAYLNDRGEIMFAGRKDYQIKHRGYRIELGEIETAATSLAEIDGACAVHNSERQQIELFYVGRADLTPAEIRHKLSALLPKYMLPTAFHRLSAMPRNPNGKIDRLELAALASRHLCEQ